MKYWLFFLSLILFNALYGKQADYYLFSAEGSGVILDKYEQRLTDPLLPGTPFRLLQKNILLSDGITKAHKFLFNKNIFYMIPDSPKLNLIRNCTVIEDTVELINEKNQLQKTDGTFLALKKDHAVQRIFRKGNRTYVSSDAYGWSRLPTNSWKFVKKQSVKEDEGLPDNLRIRILGQIQTVNLKYKEFYNHFNKKHKQTAPIPEWEFFMDEKSREYYLKNTVSTIKLIKSNAALKSELDRILAGSRFKCEQTGTQLIISSRR